MTPSEQQPHRFWHDLKLTAGLFVSSRLLVIAVAVLGPLLFKTDVRFPGRITDIGWRAYVNVWDVGWYGNVALGGYRYVAGGDSNVVFFPAFPLLLRGLNAIGIDFLVAGLLISNLCFAVSLWLFLRLIEKETGRRETAEWAAALMAFSPAAAWFSLGLTESLFLFLTLALVTEARTRRWGWMLAAGFAAGLTRPNGFLLVLPAIVLVSGAIGEAWRDCRWCPLTAAAIAAITPVLGHLSFLGYLQRTFGSWRVYQSTAAEHWHSGLSFSWVTLSQRLPSLGLHLFDQPMVYIEHVAWSWVFVLAVGAVAAIALWERRAPAWHGVLLFGFMAFHAFVYQGATPAGPIARYAAVIPAFYLGLALFCENRRWARPATLAFSVAALVLQTVMIFAGYHIN